MSQTNNPCNNCQSDCNKNGCAVWRKWFIDWWNEMVYIGPKPKPREVYRYEHPDRLREMAQNPEENMTAAEWMAKQMEGKHDA